MLTVISTWRPKDLLSGKRSKELALAFPVYSIYNVNIYYRCDMVDCFPLLAECTEWECRFL